MCIDIFNTGHHQAAVFEAFRILEVAIREAAGYGPNEHGETMINDAFNEKTGGPLVDATAPKSEQRAMRFLMVGSNVFSEILEGIEMSSWMTRKRRQNC